MSQTYTKYIVVNGKVIPINTGARPFAEMSTREGLDRRYSTLQERIIKYLITNGVSQKEFTRLMKLAAIRDNMNLPEHWVSFSDSATSAWCRGRYCPEPQRLALIAKYTSVPEEWFKGRIPLNAVKYRDPGKKAMIFHLDDPNFRMGPIQTAA